MATMLQGLYPGLIGQVLYWIIMIGTLAGLFSTWNGMFMAAVRLLDTMGTSGLLPDFCEEGQEKDSTRGYHLLLCGSSHWSSDRI